MKYIKFYRYLIPFWKREVLILFLSLLSVALGLVNPYLTKLIIDEAYIKKDLGLFIVLVAIGGVIFILNSIFSGINKYLGRYIKLRINFDLNRKVFSKLQRLSYEFFQDKSTGEHLYKISYDVEQAAKFVADILPQAISLIPKALLILVIVFYLNWKMALFSLLLAPFLYLVPLYFNARLKKIYTIWIENSQGIFKRLQDVFSHIQLVKAFGKERRQIKEYIKGIVENIRFSLKNTRLETMGFLANSFINKAISGLIIFYGGCQVIKGRMTLGSLSAISIYLAQLSGLQNSFANFFQQLSLGSVSCERLEEIIDAPLETGEDKKTKDSKFLEGEIEFKNVRFAYKSRILQAAPGAEKAVFSGLSFRIEGGSCVGLVGPSGCGKTTIINLLLRLYKLNEGGIFIDGYNINDVKAKSFYEQIGVALQEPYLWNDTIENNIRYGKKEAGFKEVQTAARVACIDEFINSLPDGYNTIIGENACKISEGQKQRIAIARAVIKRPKILILDEALSSVDSEIEGRIIDNIRDSLPDSTLIVISHRASAIKRTDQICLIEGPDKIDIGRHEKLNFT